jgi:hypothetical protein
MPEDGDFIFGNSDIAFKAIGALGHCAFIGGEGELWIVSASTAVSIDKHET